MKTEHEAVDVNEKHVAQKSTLSHTRAEDYSRRKFEIARIVYRILRSREMQKADSQ